MSEIGIEVGAGACRVRIGRAGLDLTILGEAPTIAARLPAEWRSRRAPCLDKRLLVGSPLTRQSASGGGARRQRGPADFSWFSRWPISRPLLSPCESGIEHYEMRRTMETSMESTEGCERSNPSRELFRREAVNAARTQDLARARIARPWGVLAIAGTSLPLLAALLAVLTNYSYETASFSRGFVRTANEAPCANGAQPGLVGVLRVDELHLSRLSEGAIIPLQAPAISPRIIAGKVVCIAEATAAQQSGRTKAEFEVVVSLDQFRSTAHRQSLRAGMTVQAITQHSNVKLWKLFIKDDRNAH